jgi:CHAD domain-containing protein
MAANGKSFSRSISTYHDERWKAIRKHIKLLHKSDDEETVHKLRVEIKKITALFEFVGYCDRHFDDKKVLKPLRHIFKLLGRLRGHSNALSLCLEFKIDIGILDHERHKLKGTHKKIIALAEKHKSDFRKIQRSAAKHLHHTNADQWKKYLHEKHLEISDSLAGTPTAEHVHETRMAIKSLIYNAAWFAPVIIKRAEIDRLDKTEKLINRWHDVCVFRSKLDVVNYKTSSPKIYAAIKKKEQLMMKEIRQGK